MNVDTTCLSGCLQMKCVSIAFAFVSFELLNYCKRVPRYRQVELCAASGISKSDCFCTYKHGCSSCNFIKQNSLVLDFCSLTAYCDIRLLKCFIHDRPLMSPQTSSACCPIGSRCRFVRSVGLTRRNRCRFSSYRAPPGV